MDMFLDTDAHSPIKILYFCSSPYTYIYDVLVRQRLVWLVVFCVFEQDFVHVGWSVLIQFVWRAEYDQGDFAVAQNTQLVGFLHHSKLSLIERHLQGK